MIQLPEEVRALLRIVDNWYVSKDDAELTPRQRITRGDALYEAMSTVKDAGLWPEKEEIVEPPKKAKCRRFRALTDLPVSPEHAGGKETSLFSKGDILVEVAPGWATLRPDDTLPGFIGLAIHILDRSGKMHEMLEEIDPIIFDGTENFETLKDDLMEALPEFDAIVSERVGAFKGTALEGPLNLIARGLKCLKGNHDPQPCQLGHEGIFACPHCGTIWHEPEFKDWEECECGYPDSGECKKNQDINGVHLRKMESE